jgi:hypothetical protein
LRVDLPLQVGDLVIEELLRLVRVAVAAVLHIGVDDGGARQLRHGRITVRVADREHVRLAHHLDVDARRIQHELAVRLGGLLDEELTGALHDRHALHDLHLAAELLLPVTEDLALGAERALALATLHEDATRRGVDGRRRDGHGHHRGAGHEEQAEDDPLATEEDREELTRGRLSRRWSAQDWTRSWGWCSWCGPHSLTMRVTKTDRG